MIQELAMLTVFAVMAALISAASYHVGKLLARKLVELLRKHRRL